LVQTDEERKAKHNEKMRKWREKNPEKVKEQNKKRKQAKIEWSKKNPQKRLETDRKYYEKNKEKIIAYQKEWAKKNRLKLSNQAVERYRADPEKARAQNRERYAKNPEQYRKRQNEYHAKDPEKYRKLTEEYRKKNPEKIKAYRTKYQLEKKEWLKERHKSKEYVITKKKRRETIKSMVFTAYSKRISKSEIPCCNCCGLNDHLDFLSIDHIDGRNNLSDEEKNLKGGKLYAWLIKHRYPKGYQVLCWNCNSAKGMKKNNNKCPHETARIEETFAMMEEQSSFEV
jgi:hypothetical protein